MKLYPPAVLFPINWLFFNLSSQGEFEKFGQVTDVYNTGKGFAFVTYGSKQDAQTATRELDGATVCGQQVKVNEARPKGDGGGGRGGGGGGYGGGRGGGGYGGGGGSYGGGGYGGDRGGGSYGGGGYGEYRTFSISDLF